MYKIDSAIYRTYEDLESVLNDEFLENCFLNESFNSCYLPVLGIMPTHLKETHEMRDYHGEVKACTIKVTFTSKGLHQPTLNDVAGIANLIREYYCDHEICMGLVGLWQGTFYAYFVIDPLHIDINEIRVVSHKDILNLCHKSREDNTYKGYLTPDYDPLSLLGKAATMMLKRKNNP